MSEVFKVSIGPTTVEKFNPYLDPHSLPEHILKAIELLQRAVESLRNTIICPYFPQATLSNLISSWPQAMAYMSYANRFLTKPPAQEELESVNVLLDTITGLTRAVWSTWRISIPLQDFDPEEETHSLPPKLLELITRIKEVAESVANTRVFPQDAKATTESLQAAFEITLPLVREVTMGLEKLAIKGM